MTSLKVFKTCFFWVNYLETPIEEKKFSYKLKLFTDNSRKNILVNGPAFSVNEHHVTLTYTGSMFKPFKLTFEEIKEIWDQSKVSLLWEVQVFDNPADSNTTPNVTELL